ncbi:DUF3326 domain-containing protein [Synechococcus sp. Nb3U1]|uniref:DUF3326 domain-containing protein n=1 Tax=Synechococcus sp. Nb3U1 TaxID=1914529 RepID=UPI001F289489|nr:DUF3326 domain-containing protein [Synechococcus sp. Nb3U1]MCF2969844.1 DUF3326 domain-containing protein [Synechococcus sp. Nb3U1]
MKPYTTLLLIPTGIGACIGGFAGDALPIARTLAAAVERLITHPNVLNGASLFWPMGNVLYVEGYGLDQFCAGRWHLRPVRQNRVGVVLDAGIPADLQQRQLHVIQAAQATLGLDVGPWRITSQPLGISLSHSPSGASQGSLAHPDALLEAAQDLLNSGAEAIAVVARFPDNLDFSQYEQGVGVDPLAGVEAILSHLVVRQLRIPCAHAPAFYAETDPKPVHPRAAAEEVGFTFLPSVLAGLSYAPQFVPHPAQPGDIQAKQVDSVIAPATAFGGPGMLHLASRSKPPLLIAVRDNTTVMRVHPGQLGIPYVEVSSYLEAIGAIVAHRAGVSLPSVWPQR